MSVCVDPGQALAIICKTLQTEGEAIFSLKQQLSTHQRAYDGQPPIIQALNLLLACTGRVIVSGMGKSGHIARKIAATFASTGTAAFFIHPAEAAHGDLGMITPSDVFMAISHSGKTDELMAVVPVIKRLGVPFIALTGQACSPLAQLATVHVEVKVSQEACPLNLAPTASTTAALALGDALALALLDARGFQAEDFARCHPGGTLGRRLITRVSDVMRTGQAIPQVMQAVSLAEALMEISQKGMGMTAIVDAHHHVMGIFTDGDLRRFMAGAGAIDLHQIQITNLMQSGPKTIFADQLAVDAVYQMEQTRINQLLVTDRQFPNHLVGAVHLHDLADAKLI